MRIQAGRTCCKSYTHIDQSATQFQRYFSRGIVVCCMSLRSRLRRWRHRACHCSGICLCDGSRDDEDGQDKTGATIVGLIPIGRPIMLPETPPIEQRAPENTPRTLSTREAYQRRRIQETFRWRNRVNHFTMEPDIRDQTFLTLNMPVSQDSSESTIYHDALESFEQAPPPAPTLRPASPAESVRGFRNMIRIQTRRLSAMPARWISGSSSSSSTVYSKEGFRTASPPNQTAQGAPPEGTPTLMVKITGIDQDP